MNEDAAQRAVRAFIAALELRTHEDHPLLTAEGLDAWGSGPGGSRVAVTCTDAALVVLLRSFDRRKR